jgi:hypothetical protein
MMIAKGSHTVLEMPAAAAIVTKHAPERNPKHVPPSIDGATRSLKSFFSQLQGQQERVQRRDATDAAATSSAAGSAGKVEHRRLRRSEAYETLAEAVWQKIQALRAGYMAYREHFEGADAAMLEHLNDAGDTGSASMTAEERERLEALKKDYNAWRTYTRTGRLPERVFSEGFDLPTVEPENYDMLAYLTPAQREQFLSSLNAQREYQRLGLFNPKKRAAWLAAKGYGRGVRRALYAILHSGYKVVKKLQKAAQRQMKAAGAAPKRPAAATQRAPRSAPATRRRGPERVWTRYLDAEARERVDALLPSYNEYSRLQQTPAQRDAWLAADDESGARQALYDKLYADHTEYQRLYYEAIKKRDAARRQKRRSYARRRAPGDEGKR